MEKLEIRVVIKYFCEKEMPEDFMETFRKESTSNSTVTKWAADFKKAGESIEDDGRSAPPPPTGCHRW